MISEYEDLKDYLNQFIPPLQVTILMDGFEVVRKVKGDIVLANLSLLLAGVKQLEKTNSIDEIRFTLLTFLEECISGFGIFLNEEELTSENLPQLTLLLRGLVDLEEYDYPDEILTTLDVCQDTNEAMAEILAIVTGEEMDTFYTCIERVSDEFTAKLYQLFKERVEEQDEEVEQSLPPINAEYFKHPLLKDKIDYPLLDTLSQGLGRLSLPSILRVYGNRLADLCSQPKTFETGVVSFTFALLAAKGSPKPEQLFELWGNHFLEAQAMLSAAAKIKQYYYQITGDKS